MDYLQSFDNEPKTQEKNHLRQNKLFCINKTFVDVRSFTGRLINFTSYENH